MEQRHLVYVSGLEAGNRKQNPFSPRVLESWGAHGYTVHEIDMKWGDGAPFSEKLSRILKIIDELVAKKQKIFLLGVSAGASSVLNAYGARKKSIAGVAAVAGWLKATGMVPDSVVETHGHSKAFVASVRMFAKRMLPTLSEDDRSKIITLRPKKDTKVINPDLSSVDGALNIELPVEGHIKACLAASHEADTMAEFFASK